MDLTNKVVFVTGAANGIGAACSKALVAKGAKVILADIDETNGAALAERLNEEHSGNRALFVKCDTSDENNFKDAFGKGLSTFKQIDIMLNNAGILCEGQWKRMINVNLKGTINGTELAVAHMRKDKGGQGGIIINIASELGFKPVFCFPVYSATKHGIIGYTRSLAGVIARENCIYILATLSVDSMQASPDLKERGIRYTVLCPVKTDTGILGNFQPTTCRDGYYDITKPLVTPVGLNDPTIVAEGLLSLLAEEDSNGAVVEIDKGLVRKKITVEDM